MSILREWLLTSLFMLMALLLNTASCVGQTLDGLCTKASVCLNANSSDFDKSLFLTLLHFRDQEFKQGQYEELRERYGQASPEFLAFAQRCHKQDSSNVQMAIRYLELFGHPKSNEMATSNRGALLLVFQNCSDLDLRLAYLPIFLAAYKDGAIGSAAMENFLLWSYRMKEGKDLDNGVIAYRHPDQFIEELSNLLLTR